MMTEYPFRGRVRLDSQPVVAVALIRDRQEIPSFLVSTRISGLDAGDETLWGGRIRRGESVAGAAIREGWEEIGVSIRNPGMFIGLSDPPVRVETRAGVRDLHILFADYRDLRGSGRIVTRERHKNTPWRWASLPEIVWLVESGVMHPAFLERFWKKEVKLCPRIVRGIPIEVYDFPHYPLHTTEELHAPLSPKRYPRSERFPL